MIENEEACSATLEDNRVRQAQVAEELAEKQKELAALREEETKLKGEQKQGKNAKKRLRHTLSERERGLIEFGIELALHKRARLSEEVSSDDDDEEER